MKKLPRWAIAGVTATVLVGLIAGATRASFADDTSRLVSISTNNGNVVEEYQTADGHATLSYPVITNDVPPKALGVARERQRNVEGYADREKKS